MNIIIAILIFSLIVIIHELGHFLLAKANGVFVTEFSIGMGPRIISFVKTEKGFKPKFFLNQSILDANREWTTNTMYSWKVFPLGGSCMMLGEDENIEDERAFNKKGVWARISVIFAGPFFNFILAFLIALIVISNVGYDSADIVKVEDNLPAKEAGLQVGDIITSINGTNIDVGREFFNYLQFHPFTKEKVILTVIRDGQKLENPIEITPELVDKSYKLGITVNPTRNKIRKNALLESKKETTNNAETYKVAPETEEIITKDLNALGIIKYSAIEVKYVIVSTIEGLSQLIRGKVSADQMAGPVGIVDIIGETVEQSKIDGALYVFLNLANISILLTANLGVMNLLPIPALDGGRLVFLFIELFRRKPIDQSKEGFVHMIGFVLLMLLMVFVMFNDIRRILGF